MEDLSCKSWLEPYWERVACLEGLSTKRLQTLKSNSAQRRYQSIMEDYDSWGVVQLYRTFEESYSNWSQWWTIRLLVITLSFISFSLICTVNFNTLIIIDLHDSCNVKSISNLIACGSPMERGMQQHYHSHGILEIWWYLTVKTHPNGQTQCIVYLYEQWAVLM